MGKLFKGLFILVLLLVAAGGAIHLTGNTMNAFVWLLKPRHDFDLALKAPAPDYTDPVNWAALPEFEDLADLTPEGIPPRSTPSDFDVFFIHPTGYMNRAEWNSPMDPDSNTEENTKWMLANQASAFNDCCDVYAPRYREGSIFIYLNGDPELLNQALDFAYQDVERAFDHFIANRSNGRPFVIASHSQGTHHAMTLLKNRISGTPLRDRMVAAYVIGGGVTRQAVDQLPDLSPCDAPDDLHCIIHFATYGEGGDFATPWIDGTLLCTNPLTWKNEGPRAEAEHHKGAVHGSGDFSLGLFGPDVAKGIVFDRQPEPEPHVTWAACQDGTLIVRDLGESAYKKGTLLPGKNYHGLDYPLFYIDIRDNARLRTAAWSAAQNDPTP